MGTFFVEPFEKRRSLFIDVTFSQDEQGKRVDDIVTCPQWKFMKDVAAEEGLVHIGYQREKYGAAARVMQFTKLMLFHPSGAFDAFYFVQVGETKRSD